MTKPNQARTKAIQAAERKLTDLSTTLQSEYYEKVWRSVSGGVVADKAGQIKVLASNPIFVRAWKEIVGKGLNDFLKEELKAIEQASAKYYAEFAPSTDKFDKVKEKVEAKMRKALDGYLIAFNGSTKVATATRNFIIGQISAGVSMADVRGTAEAFIKGTPQKLGVVDNFNLYENRIQDTFAEYDRRMSNQYATSFDLNYFIYQGGEIKTTRQFCEERNAGVFTREQGESWNELEWEGKNTEINNVLLTAGGYNCRHYFDWISYELAVQLDPNIKKSKYD